MICTKSCNVLEHWTFEHRQVQPISEKEWFMVLWQRVTRTDVSCLSECKYKANSILCFMSHFCLLCHFLSRINRKASQRPATFSFFSIPHGRAIRQAAATRLLPISHGKHGTLLQSPAAGPGAPGRERDGAV
jgi:hypothetical protein